MTEILYRPLKPGEIITKECVHFADITNVPKAPRGLDVGTTYDPNVTGPFFLPVELPDPLVSHAAAIAANWTICTDPDCPLRVSHYVGSAPDCTAHPSDPLAAIKAANAAGKVIQLHSVQKHELPFHKLSEEEWYDCSPQWAPNRYYRIKPGQDDVKEITPAPEKAEEWVPLGPEDVPPGSIMRRKEWSNAWQAVVAVYSGGVNFNKKLYEWEELMDVFDVSRDFGKTWEPCRKKAVVQTTRCPYCGYAGHDEEQESCPDRKYDAQKFAKLPTT